MWPLLLTAQPRSPSRNQMSSVRELAAGALVRRQLNPGAGSVAMTSVQLLDAAAVVDEDRPPVRRAIALLQAERLGVALDGSVRRLEVEDVGFCRIRLALELEPATEAGGGECARGGDRDDRCGR